MPVPVTTGSVATVWTLFQNTLTLHERFGGAVAVVGSASPVGRAMVQLLCKEEIATFCDSKRAARETTASVCSSAEAAAQEADIVVGAAPTGPVLEASALRPGAVVVDVALPTSLKGKPDETVRVYSGEAMSMPSFWRRGFWGPIYHLVSGYGWNTVLACLVEPAALVFSKKNTPFAQGNKLQLEQVTRFGEAAQQMGFCAQLRRERLRTIVE